MAARKGRRATTRTAPTAASIIDVPARATVSSAQAMPPKTM